MTKALAVASVLLLTLAPAALGGVQDVMLLNPQELDALGWDYSVIGTTVELTEHWTKGMGPVCVELENMSGGDITLEVVKWIHNNDPSGPRINDFHNALMVPDNGGWIPSNDTDGLFFTGMPIGAPPSPNQNAWSNAGWSNLEDALADTLDFFAPPGGSLGYCEWVQIGFQVTMPVGMIFNLDQYPTWEEGLIPEPATPALVALGALALVVRRRRA